jgi:predicted nucleic acid-binding protein
VTATKVVDASALCALLFGEPEAEEIAGRIAGARLLSPTLLNFEVANVCWKKCRRDPERREAHLAAHALLNRFEIETVNVDHAEVLTLALGTGLTVYDASYLWLCRRLSAELVSLDGALNAAAAVA